jgi:hypothetical protein
MTIAKTRRDEPLLSARIWNSFDAATTKRVIFTGGGSIFV